MAAVTSRENALWIAFYWIGNCIMPVRLVGFNRFLVEIMNNHVDFIKFVHQLFKSATKKIEMIKNQR